MPSFFEKLKKGMGVDEVIEEKTEEPEGLVGKKTVKKKKKPKLEKPKKLEIKAETIEEEKGREEEVKEEIEEEEEEKKSVTVKVPEDKEKWFEEEGELAIDIYQTEDDLIIQSAIAGIKPENLDIIIEKDILTIKGSREKPSEEGGDYFSQECFWGPFSREVILPVEIDPGRIEASMKEGILTIRLPKILKEKKRKITVRV